MSVETSPAIILNNMAPVQLSSGLAKSVRQSSREYIFRTDQKFTLDNFQKSISNSENVQIDIPVYGSVPAQLQKWAQRRGGTSQHILIYQVK